MEFYLVIKHETLVNAFFLSLKLKNEMIHPQDKMKDRLSNNHLHASNALNLNIDYTQVYA